VAYQAPDTALHHLKMAKAYLDEADKEVAKDKKPDEFVSEAKIRALAKAARHLNRAREIDPNEVLWVEDEEDEVGITLDQDYLNGRVLVKEGIAHLNAVHYISNSFRCLDGTVDRESYKKAIGRLHNARIALEKALTYIPASETRTNFSPRRTNIWATGRITVGCSRTVCKTIRTISSCTKK